MMATSAAYYPMATLSARYKKAALEAAFSLSGGNRGVNPWLRAEAEGVT